jgi:hypothetical protein
MKNLQLNYFMVTQIYTIYFKCDSIKIDFQWNSKIKAII